MISKLIIPLPPALRGIWRLKRGEGTTRRRFLTTALTTAGLLLPGGSLLYGAAEEVMWKSRPNVLFIIVDQMTVSAMGCAGNAYIKTPNLDALAARGTRFEKSYCTNPLCSPARSSLFSSHMPHEMGIYLNNNCELARKGVPTMGELFQAAGYETAYAGKWHLEAPFPAHVHAKIPGFEVLPLQSENPHSPYGKLHGRGRTVDPQTTAASIEFLKRRHSKPFLLVASLLNPHDICEFTSCPDIQALVTADPAQLPPVRSNLRDTEPLPSMVQKRQIGWGKKKWREYLCAYYRLVEDIDAKIGNILGTLKDQGLDGNTVVVFTSDHGDMNGSHHLAYKQELYEEAVHVPLIVAVPGATGRVNQDCLVSGLDIMPTLLDYAGIAISASLEGRSIRAAAEGKSGPGRKFLVAENAVPESWMARTVRYKYILYSNSETPEQFFDLERDPGELHNLIDRPDLADEITRHRQILQKWMWKSKDSLGHEPVRNNVGGHS